MTSKWMLVPIFIFAAAAPMDVSAEDGFVSREVVVQSMTGTVEYQAGGQGEWIQASAGDVLQETAVVRTGDGATCSLLFRGMSNAVVEMRPGTVMELSKVSEAQAADDTSLGLSIGSVLVKAEKLQGESSFQVRTPNSIVGIRGTEFEVSVD